MSYTLIAEAKKFTALGYMVGLTSAKNLVGRYHSGTVFDGSWDGISLILEGLICVDFDDKLSFDCGYGNDLPATLKESSPRGFHLFYRKDPNNDPFVRRESKIKWKPHVDLLTHGKRVRYGRAQAEAHALVYPTPGYQRIYPDNVPSKDELTMAPQWLEEAVKA
jgi:hypothetical protein